MCACVCISDPRLLELVLHDVVEVRVDSDQVGADSDVCMCAAVRVDSDVCVRSSDPGLLELVLHDVVEVLPRAQDPDDPP